MSTLNDLSLTERQVLEEYSRLVKNLAELNETIQTLSTQPTSAILDSLRALEKRMGLVLTLFKASVYAIIVANEAADSTEREYENNVLAELDNNRPLGLY